MRQGDYWESERSGDYFVSFKCSREENRAVEIRDVAVVVMK